MAAFKVISEQPHVLLAVDCLHTEELEDSKVSISDVLRAVRSYTWIRNNYREHDCSVIACELPTAGTKDSRAARCMGIISGVIASVCAELQCPVIWITPDESRAAGGWIKKEHLIPKPDTTGMRASERKKLLAEHARALSRRNAELKNLVMQNMEKRYPIISGMKKKDKEHIADALATFEAAVVKGLPTTNILRG